jgi:hypothetical protein
MGCFLDFLTKKHTLKNICAIRGAKQGYVKWWNMLRSKTKMDRYLRRKLRRKHQKQANLDYYKKLSKELDNMHTKSSSRDSG